MAIALSFASTPDDQAVSIATAPGLNPGMGNFTVVFHAKWAVGAPLVDFSRPISKRQLPSVQSPSYEVWTRVRGAAPNQVLVLEGAVYDEAGNGVFLSAPFAADIRDGLWHQWAIVFVRGTPNDGLLLFRDHVADTIGEAATVGAISPTGPLIIGAAASNEVGEYNSGVVCEIANVWIVPRALHWDELAQYANLYLTSVDATAWWKLNEGAGLICADSKGANGGTLAAPDNTPTWDTDAGHSLVYPGAGEMHNVTVEDMRIEVTQP